MMELNLLQDVVVGDKDITDVPLRYCWKEIHFVHQTVSDLSSVTLPLFDVKFNEQRLSTEIDTINLLVGKFR